MRALTLSRAFWTIGTSAGLFATAFTLVAPGALSPRLITVSARTAASRGRVVAASCRRCIALLEVCKVALVTLGTFSLLKEGAVGFMLFRLACLALFAFACEGKFAAELVVDVTGGRSPPRRSCWSCWSSLVWVIKRTRC